MSFKFNIFLYIYIYIGLPADAGSDDDNDDKQIADQRPILLHVACHGTVDGGLYLCSGNDAKEAHFLTKELVQKKLASSSLLESVFLSCCFAGDFVFVAEANLKRLVSLSGFAPTTAELVNTFAVSFYSKLFESNVTASTAFNHAKSKTIEKSVEKQVFALEAIAKKAVLGGTHIRDALVTDVNIEFI